MSSQIRETRKELQSSRNRTQSLRGELAVRSQQASDGQVEARIWQVRCDIALGQRDGLVAAIGKLSQQLVRRAAANTVSLLCLNYRMG